MTADGILEALSTAYLLVLGLVFGGALCLLGLIALTILRSEETGVRAVGCSLAAMLPVLVGIAILAATFGVDWSAILGVHLREEDVSGVVLGFCGLSFAVIGLVILAKPELFTPAESDRVDSAGSFVDSMLAMRPLEAILGPIFRALPPQVAARVWGVLSLVYAGVFFAGVDSPDYPRTLADSISAVETPLLVGLYAILTIALFAAFGRALFLRNRGGLRDAGCFASLWIGLTVIGMLSGFLAYPLRLLIGN